MLIERNFDDITVSTNETKLDYIFIHNYLKRSYWTPNLSYSDLIKKMTHSVNFGVYLKDRQIGYARVVTDFSVFAYLADVFIIEEFQGNGYSKLLVQTIVEHPEFKDMNRFFLRTEDAQGLYKKFGFSTLKNPETMMER